MNLENVNRLTPNDVDLVFLLVPTMANVMMAWRIEVLRFDADTIDLGTLLLRLILWGVAGLVVMIVFSAVTTGIYCETCSRRPAGSQEYVPAVLYLCLALLLLRRSWRRLLSIPSKPRASKSQVEDANGTEKNLFKHKLAQRAEKDEELTAEQLMAKYEILFDGERYEFAGYKYRELSEAARSARLAAMREDA